MTIFRWTVPCDDQWHRRTHVGSFVHVGSRQGGVVEFWTDNDVEVHTISDGLGNILTETFDPYDLRPRDHWYRIFGTGQDTDGLYLGTTYDGGTSDLVWHLFEKRTDPTDPKES